MTDQLVIYHGNCADGFGAAYAAHLAMPDAEFYPGVYQQEPPDATDRYVYMLDFSYKRPVILDMAQRAKRIVILDHHLSAMEDLKDLNSPKVSTYFDMNKSGAVISWEFFNLKSKSVPDLFKYIQDRDLWKHELPRTKEVNAAIFSFEYNFDVWAKLVATPINDLADEGEAILRKQNKDLKELLPLVTRKMPIGEYADIPVANLPYMLASEAGHILSKDAPFAATYFDTEDGRQFSLRSAEYGVDVSEIAKKYGGGGHKHAAGFRVPRHHFLAVM